jgi:predicted transposase YdaD
MFVTMVEDFQKSGDLRDEAIDKAIHSCRESGIMGAYLENHREVRRMLITEWDDDEYREVLLEEGMERGREQGRIDIARRLKAEGAKSALIVKVTGLSEKDIAVL